jgi:GT2 family glycosyltransferase
VSHDRVVHSLQSIDVLVVPSIWPENSPLVIREAFLAGIPVVASAIGGIPEAVTDGRNGLLFRPGDVEELHRVLVRLVEEPALLPTLRAGIPAVQSIEDDVRVTRGIYQAHLARPAITRRMAAVVLHYRTPDDTWLTVRSLLASRRVLDEILIVNNDAADAGAGPAPEPGVSVLTTGGNHGFSGGMNAGIRAALDRGATHVLLVNSDVIVPPDCVARLEQCLDASPAAGIAGPVVLARSNPARVESLGMSLAPQTGRMRPRGCGGSTARLDVPGASVVDGVAGCLMLIRREVFDEIGLLDEDYFFSFEDLDLCLRARAAGFTTVLAGSARVHHEGGRSIGAESPRRLYFAARNHLLLAHRLDPSAGRLRALVRASSIVTLNLAHAARAKGGSLPARVGAVMQGTFDYFAGRFGRAEREGSHEA